MNPILAPRMNNDEELERKQAEQRRKAQEAAEKDQKIVDQIMESGRLFVRNLPFAASEDEIQGFFGSFGTVKQVSVISTELSSSCCCCSGGQRGV